MDIEHMALMIPILGIVMGVGIAIIAILTAHREKQKRVELRHRERLAAIEKGIELAPDPEPDAGVKKTSSLKSGLSGVLHRRRAVLRALPGGRRRRRAVRPHPGRARHRDADQLFRRGPEQALTAVFIRR